MLKAFFSRLFGSKPEKTRPVQQDITEQNPEGTNREEIRKKLAELAASAPLQINNIQAMCYSPVMPIYQAEYICPICGEKTLYSGTQDEPNRSAWTVNRTVPACRRLVKEVKDLNVSIDESSFCRNCSSDEDPPTIRLIIRYENQTRYVPINDDQLKLLVEFTNGMSTHSHGSPDMKPLKDYVDQISGILGVDLNEQF